MSTPTKNDIAWERLFDKFNIVELVLENGLFEISAAQINAEREARLMTKIDHSIQLPEIFKKNKFTILPNSRGTYVIGGFESYHPVPPVVGKKIEEISFPDNITTVDPLKIYSESAAILCADISGMLAKVLGEELRLTVFGRMSTGEFTFSILNKIKGEEQRMSVSNSQCEIDAAFEGDETFAILEVKNDLPEDFLIRQLYYPFRLWRAKTTKRIVPILMTFSDDTFNFFTFKFISDSSYNSLVHLETHRFQIAGPEIEIKDLEEVFCSIKITTEGDVSFPQANDFSKVVDLLSHLYDNGGCLTKDEITTLYAFDSRQTLYYTSAARYLSLIDRVRIEGKTNFCLSSLGIKAMKCRRRERKLALATAILRKPVFYASFKLYLEASRPPTKVEIIEIMSRASLRIDGSTIPRRSQTVSSWIDWVLSLSRS